MRNLCIVTIRNADGYKTVYTGTVYGIALKAYQDESAKPENLEVAYYWKPTPIKYKRQPATKPATVPVLDDTEQEATPEVPAVEFASAEPANPKPIQSRKGTKTK